jgi:hypothetical protein
VWLPLALTEEAGGSRLFRYPAFPFGTRECPWNPFAIGSMRHDQ